MPLFILKVLLFISDPILYMMKGGQAVSIAYPKIICTFVLCWNYSKKCCRIAEIKKLCKIKLFYEYNNELLILKSFGPRIAT